jgi:hypothetical protein
MLWRHFVVTTAAAWLCAFAADAAVELKANRPPIITGTIPNSSVGADYFFLPDAKDPEGDALTFTLTGAPSWMIFRASDGRIVGRPPEAAVYHNVVLSVRDSAGNTTSLPPATVTITTGPANKARASSPSFASSATTGNARLSWTRPTHNADGTVLTNLAGYRISYDTTPDDLTKTVQVADPSATTYTINGLAPGTYYFAVRAYGSDGRESGISSIVKKVVR